MGTEVALAGLMKAGRGVLPNSLGTEVELVKLTGDSGSPGGAHWGQKWHWQRTLGERWH